VFSYVLKNWKWSSAKDGLEANLSINGAQVNTCTWSFIPFRRWR